MSKEDDGYINISDVLEKVAKIPEDAHDSMRVSALHHTLKYEHNIFLSEKDCKKLLGID